MKLKVNLKDGVAGFFTQHGEKLVLGATLLVFLMLTWSAIKRPRIEASKSPTSIQQQAQTASAHIEQKAWEPQEADVPAPPNYDQLIALSLKPVPAAALRQPVAWNPPEFEPPTKRGEPKLFAPVELQGISNRAAIALVSPDQAMGGFGFGAPPIAGRGGAPARVLSDAEYERSLSPDDGPVRGGRRPPPAAAQADLLQNRQVPPGVLPGVKPNTAADMEGRRYVVLTGLVPLRKQEEEYHRRFGDAQYKPQQGDAPTYHLYRVERTDLETGAKQVFDQHSREFLTWWYEAGLNVPNIARNTKRWAEVVPEVAAQDQVHPMLTFRLPPMFLKDWGRDATHPKIPLESDRMAAIQTGMGAVGVPGMQPFGGPQMGPGAAMSDDGTPIAGGPGMPMGAGGFGVVSPEHLLFRFFDFSVQPGRSYQYRVRLIMNNPNFQVPIPFLENPELAKAQYLETEWSDPSPVIEVPQDHQVLASALSRTSAGTRATVRIVAWDHARGVEVSTEEAVELGGVANFTRDVKDVIIPNKMMFEDFKAFPFRTNLTLVDARGGEPIDGVKDLRSPVELLWVDPQGKALVSNEARDTLTYEDHKRRTQVPANSLLPGGNFGAGGGLFPDDDGGPRNPRGRMPRGRVIDDN